jgi:uncharacterized protein (DUF1330 family)
MAAYMIVNLQVTDPNSFKEFQERFPPVLERYGGKYLARGGKAERWEGVWEPRRVVIFEFPSLDHAKRLYESKEYEPLKAIRMRSSKSDLIVVEGL